MKRFHQKLPFTPPLFPDNLFGHLVATAVPGVEEWRGGAYRRSLRLAHGAGVVALSPFSSSMMDCVLLLEDSRDRAEGIATARFLLDLDADPEVIDQRLGEDPALRPLVEKAAGRRVPRVADGSEFAVRALLGQQVSTAAARTHAARLVVAHGEAIDDPEGG